MSKYARYSIWLAKAIVVFTAVLSFVKFFVTYDDAYAAMFAASMSVFMALDIYSHMTEIKKRIEIIESKQRGFMSFETAIAAEQLDCKERVDKLAKTLNGDE